LENTAMANHPVNTRATRFAIKIVLLSLPNALYRRASITRSRNDMVIDPSFPIVNITLEGNVYIWKFFVKHSINSWSARHFAGFQGRKSKELMAAMSSQ